MKQIQLNSNEHSQFINITNNVAEAVAGLGLRNGVAMVFVPHTTAGVTINENTDPNVAVDIIAALEKIVPWQGAYKHEEGNSAAHIKASMMGASCNVIVKSGRLQMGAWQSIYFCEFDGPRNRNVWVTIIQENDGTQ